MKLLKISCALLLGLLLGCSQPGSTGGAALMDGGTVDLKTSQPILFINYWAVWCGPCIAEMPELSKFAQDHQGEARVIGVNFDQPDAAQLHQDAKKLNVKIGLLLHDPQSELGYDRPDVLPTTFILRGGKLLETLVGPQTEASLEEHLQKWQKNS